MLETPSREASPNITALVMAAIQQSDSRMPTAAIVLQKASDLENQYQCSRHYSACDYGFFNLQYDHVIWLRDGVNYGEIPYVVDTTYIDQIWLQSRSTTPFLTGS